MAVAKVSKLRVVRKIGQNLVLGLGVLLVFSAFANTNPSYGKTRPLTARSYEVRESSVSKESKKVEGNEEEEEENEEKEGEGEEEEEEEEEEVKDVEKGISMMLMGSISFMMGLFYLVNHRDKDFRKYSWEVISSTISIFSAVLIFQGIHQIVKDNARINEEGPKSTNKEIIWFKLTVYFAEFFVWLAFMQWVLFRFSGASGPVKESDELKNNYEYEVVLETKLRSGAKKGQKQIDMASTEGFRGGCSIVIVDATRVNKKTETNNLDVRDGSLILRSPLQNDYEASNYTKVTTMVKVRELEARARSLGLERVHTEFRGKDSVHDSMNVEKEAKTPRIRLAQEIYAHASRNGTAPDEKWLASAGEYALFRKKFEKEHAELSRHLNMKSCGVLSGHLAGFAAISAFGELQQTEKKGHESILLCAGVPVLTFIALFVVFKASAKFRKRLTEKDGRTNEAEELWCEEVEETENDVMGLCISFLATQCARLIINGFLPNGEGEDEEKHKDHTRFQMFELCMLGVGVLGLMVLKTTCWAPPEGKKEEGEEEEGRSAVWFRNISAMTFAWCCYFTTVEVVTRYIEAEMVGQLVIALTVSVLAIGAIYFLDFLADSDLAESEDTERNVDNALRSSIVALSILIGFGWEKSFDLAVNLITKKVVPTLPELMQFNGGFKLAMSMLLCLIVIPAWRKYILPTIHELEQEAKTNGAIDAYHKKIQQQATEAGLENNMLTNLIDKPVITPNAFAHLTVRDLKVKTKQMEQVLLLSRLEKEMHKHHGNTHKKHCEDKSAKNEEMKQTFKNLGPEIDKLRKLADQLQC